MKPSTLPASVALFVVGLSLVLGDPRPVVSNDDGGVLSGTVYDITGAPAPDAEVMVLNTCSGKPIIASTRSDGTFQVSGLGPGSYEVTVMLPGFWRERAIVKSNGSIQQTLKFLLRPMPTHGYGDVFYEGYKPGTPFRRLSIRGTVFSEWGGPVANAMVQAKNQETGEVFKSSSNKNGICPLSGMPKGKYIVTAAASGFNTEYLSAYIEYGLDASVNFHLVPSLGIGHNEPITICSAE